MIKNINSNFDYQINEILNIFNGGFSRKFIIVLLNEYLKLHKDEKIINLIFDLIKNDLGDLKEFKFVQKNFNISNILKEDYNEIMIQSLYNLIEYSQSMVIIFFI
jgi:hypothetical protein